MLKTTLATLLFGYAMSLDMLSCPEGTGTGPDNCCTINPTAGSPSLISIPNTIKCAIIECADKACEKNVQLFTAADLTTIKCDSVDTCGSAQFVCGRGPPGSDMRDYENSGTCILEASANGAGKQSSFSIFGEMSGQVTATLDSSFGSAQLRCFGKSCTINCPSKACIDTETTGDYECTGDGCEDLEAATFDLPAIAEPDIDGNCVLEPIRGTFLPLVFKNNCGTAILNCNEASLCEKRKIYSAAQNTLITCGGEDPSKTDGTLVAGACKEAEFFFGPRFQDELPPGTDERDFDVKFTEATLTQPSEIIFNSVQLNYRGTDAGSKNKIHTTLTHLTINTEGANSFPDGIYTCGSDVGVGVAGTNCNLNCFADDNGKKSCVNCKRFINSGASYTESVNDVGEMACLDGLGGTTVTVRQGSVNGNVQSSGSESVNGSSSNIVLPVKSLYAFAIIFSVLVLGVIVGCNGFKVKKFDRRGSLIKYNTMQAVQNKA
jgi:hypothetical protein